MPAGSKLSVRTRGLSTVAQGRRLSRVLSVLSVPSIPSIRMRRSKEGEGWIASRSRQEEVRQLSIA